MLDSLRFVQGAVAKKDFAPELTHFHIRDGSIRGYNGALALSCPVDLNLDVSPKAVPFVKAIQTCEETIQLHMTPAGKLSVKSGKFKALIECVADRFPAVEPEGVEIILDGTLLKALKKLAPFIAEDASRPWARGILFRGRSAFATNNVILVEYWLGYDFPVEINIPKSAVTELIRIGEEPTKLQMSQNNVTFHFEGNRWLRTQTYSTEWPDLTRVMDRESQQVPVPNGLFAAVENLVPFVDDLGRVFLGIDSVSTGCDSTASASVELLGNRSVGCYHFEQLLLLQKVVSTIDLSGYPGPCLFRGDSLRGAIIGMLI